MGLQPVAALQAQTCKTPSLLLMLITALPDVKRQPGVAGITVVCMLLRVHTHEPSRAARSQQSRSSATYLFLGWSWDTARRSQYVCSAEPRLGLEYASCTYFSYVASSGSNLLSDRHAVDGRKATTTAE